MWKLATTYSPFKRYGFRKIEKHKCPITGDPFHPDGYISYSFSFGKFVIGIYKEISEKR
jgi:hypothetical protein